MESKAGFLFVAHVTNTLRKTESQKRKNGGLGD